MNVSRYFVILITPALISCETFAPLVTTVTGNVRCNSNESSQHFPEQGSKKEIHASFNIREGSETTKFDEVATCEYQGAICFQGIWTQVWYGNQESSPVKIELKNGDTLIHQGHNQCTRMHNFVKNCSLSDCSPENTFGMLIKFSERHKRERLELIDRGEAPEESKYPLWAEQEYVPFSKLKDYGVNTENLLVLIIDDGL